MSERQKQADFLKALLACALEAIQPDFKDDPEMLATEIGYCVPKTTIGTSPVAISASVLVGLIPTQDAQAPDIIVEMRRQYIDFTTPAGKDITIETYPKNCKLKPQ